MDTNVPSRLTSAFSATDCRNASAARLALPSCTVSNVTDTPSMTSMIRALGASPVPADTTAAAIRTRHMGSSSLRPTETMSPDSRTFASALRPYFDRRRRASADVSPTTPQPRAAADSPELRVQNG